MLKFLFGMIIGAILMVAYPNSTFRNDVKGIIESGILELHEAVDEHQGDAQTLPAPEVIDRVHIVPEPKSEESGYYDSDGNWVPPGGFKN